MYRRMFVVGLMFVIAFGCLTGSAGACDSACCSNCGPSMVCAPSDAPAGLLPGPVPNSLDVTTVASVSESSVSLGAEWDAVEIVPPFASPPKLFIYLQTLLI